MLGGMTPVPERVEMLGLVGSEDATETDAALAPAEVGVNVTVMVQEAAAAMVAVQLFDCENWLELVPVMETETPVTEEEELLLVNVNA